jgi:hypothetical protein
LLRVYPAAAWMASVSGSVVVQAGGGVSPPSGPVEAGQGMGVDGAPLLVLGDLGEQDARAVAEVVG